MITVPQAREQLRLLVEQALSGDPGAWAAGAEWLERQDGRTWLVLDQHARTYTHGSAIPHMVSGTKGWLGVDFGEPSGFVACVTSWHVDGRIRQRATTMLGGRPGALRARALAVRCLDHVPQVREDALLGLKPQAHEDRAEPVLAVLLAGRGRVFAGWALGEFLDQLDVVADRGAVLRRLTTSRDHSVRRWAYARAKDEDRLSDVELLELVTTERDQFLRAEAARWLSSVASSDQLLALLETRFVDGRLLALNRLADDDLDQDRLLSMLGDPSARVRETAQWRARRRDLDPATAYRGWLMTGERSPSRLAASLDGLSGTGSADDVELVVTRLTDPSVRVRVAAVSCLYALAPADQARPLLLPMLLDSSPRVCSAAAQGLARTGAPSALVEAAWQSSQPWSRRAAWRLSRSSGSWERVAADLRAAGDADAGLSGLGRASARNWLAAGAATTWGRPEDGVAERMAELLPSSGMSDSERRAIAFHAGLPWPDAAVAAAVSPAGEQPRGKLRLLRLKRRRGDSS